MTLIIRSVFMLSIFFTLGATAQINFFRNQNIIVKNTNGDTLKNPWAGGYNSVQFSEIDLDIDGTMDLVAFDRTGYRLSTYINSGQANTIDYTYAPEYIQNFPKLSAWVLLRDYNCDGKMDIFTYFSGGIRIYKNTTVGTTLSFALADSILQSNFQPNLITLFVSNADIPVIDDIDGDGDLDILTFSAAGSRVEYHKNLSMETRGNCDTIMYELRNRCWGYFEEAVANNSVNLFDTCGFNISNPEGSGQHAGSTLLTMDVDANNSKELILGDAAFNNLTLLYNSDATPNLTASSMTSQDLAFPSNNSSTIPVDLYVFPAGYYLDVNNDNVKDLIVATNCGGGCKNTENVWLYENNNATNNPAFNYITNSFLQEGMIEVGEGAYPVLFDYNADGLLDIVVGNYGVQDIAAAPLNYISSLWLYENIGTALLPAFELVNTDYANISALNLDVFNNRPTLRLTPTFGDLNGDGDLDLIVGDYFGYLHYFENTAGVGNPAVFVLNQAQYFAIDIGNFASPQLIDLNRDTKLDLVIGNRNGNISYYENTGTTAVPNFTWVTDTLGHINTKRYNEFNGNSMPFVYEEGSSYKMMAGSANGYMYKFGNIDGNLTGTFTTDSTYKNIWEGGSTSTTLGDINGDGNIDMLIGNHSGGLAYFQGDFPTTVEANKKANFVAFSVFPNPSNNLIYVNIGENHLQNATIEILDLLGKTILKEKVKSTSTLVSLSKLSQGVYLLKLSNDSGYGIKKIIKK